MLCPVCGGKRIGKISSKNYFCRNCYIEFNDKREVFSITEDGGLGEVFSLGPLSGVPVAGLGEGT